MDLYRPSGTDADAWSPPTVFLSYASEDRQAARQIGEALSGNGLELWYDESELGGGDAWDQKIRKQFRDCDYFMVLVLAQRKRSYNALATTYIRVGITLEEPDLVDLFGDDYRRYRNREAMLVPWQRSA